jgi:hypothetical protein
MLDRLIAVEDVNDFTYFLKWICVMNTNRVNASGVKRFPVVCYCISYPTSKMTTPHDFKSEQQSIQSSGTLHLMK